jgi:hypothetical protein
MPIAVRTCVGRKSATEKQRPLIKATETTRICRNAIYADMVDGSLPGQGIISHSRDDRASRELYARARSMNL